MARREAEAVRSLAGLAVLVTRPCHQARGLADEIAARGARPVLCPAIEIAAPRDPGAATAVADSLDRVDGIVFVSANAAERGVALVRSRRGGWPPRPRVAAIGAATAAALERLGVRVDVVPEGEATSEGLLRHPGFAASAVHGRRIAVFRGEGGRALLERGLRARGADVTVAEVYRRTRPAGTLDDVTGAEPGAFDVVTATSGEALENLYAMAGEASRERLAEAALVVASARIANVAARLGHRGECRVAAGADDRAMTDAIERLAASPSDPENRA